jgi:hypothetical protein
MIRSNIRMRSYTTTLSTLCVADQFRGFLPVHSPCHDMSIHTVSRALFDQPPELQQLGPSMIVHQWKRGRSRGRSFGPPRRPKGVRIPTINAPKTGERHARLSVASACVAAPHGLPGPGRISVRIIVLRCGCGRKLASSVHRLSPAGRVISRAGRLLQRAHTALGGTRRSEHCSTIFPRRSPFLERQE